jgi:hypothetical protein
MVFREVVCHAPPVSHDPLMEWWFPRSLSLLLAPFVELVRGRAQVYDLETSYLNDSNQNGNVLKGFEGYLAPTKTQKCAPPVSMSLTGGGPRLGFYRSGQNARVGDCCASSRRVAGI